MPASVRRPSKLFEAAGGDGDGDGDGGLLLPWVFVSDPDSEVAGEEVSLDRSDCDGLEDEEEEVALEGEGEDNGRKLLRIRTTSSNTSSSHKLSLSPSEARMRISSCSIGSVNVRAWVEGLDGESGPSWTGVLNCKNFVKRLIYILGEGRGTYAPPHFFAPPYYIFTSH
jgi:hypothetical protein